MSKRQSESGQALPIAAFLVCAMVMVALLITHTARAADLQAKAQTAADAAALAGAMSGRDAASSAASRNDALLVSFVESGGGVTVEASIGGRSAKAKARPHGGLGSMQGPTGGVSSSG